MEQLAPTGFLSVSEGGKVHLLKLVREELSGTDKIPFFKGRGLVLLVNPFSSDKGVVSELTRLLNTIRGMTNGTEVV